MKKLSRLITRLLSLTIIVLALAVVGLRLSLTYIDLFNSDIENWLAKDVVNGIQFTRIEGSWNHFNPILSLHGVSIMLPNREHTAAIKIMSVEFDLWKSLRIGSPVVREVSGSISKLSLTKDSRQQWWLNEVSLGSTSLEKTESNVEQLIAQIPYYLHLNLDQLIVIDQARGAEYQIENIQADVQQREGSYYLRLDADLPAVLGNKLNFKSIIGTENSVAYIKSDRLEIDRLASLFDLNIGGIQQAKLGGEVWLNFLSNQIVVINGNISINQGEYLPPAGDKGLQFTLDSQISMYRRQDQWNISSQIDTLSINDLPLKGFATELRVATDGGHPTTVKGWVRDFDLNNLKVLDGQLIPAKIAETLIHSDLRGQLDNAWFSFEPNDINSLRFMTQATNISSEPVNGIPGINSVDGSLVFGNQNAGLEMQSNELSLDFSDLFRAPLEIERLKIKADISLHEDGLLISAPEFEAANSDIKMTGRMWLEADQAERPFLYLRANLEDGDGSSTSKYLPASIMQKKVVNWLDRSIKAVDVSDGSLLFHGRLEQIQALEKNRSGEMMVEFGVDNTRVKFDPDWDSASNGKGRVLFHNIGVQIDLESVSYGSIDNASATISILDFNHTRVDLNLVTRTPTNTALQTWIGTPVGRKYRPLARKLHNADGAVIAWLDLTLPVGEDKSSQRVELKLQFDKAAFKAPDWGLEFSQIDGDLQVTGQGMAAKGIKALFYTSPVDIDVSTDRESDQTLINASGLIDSQQLLNLLPDYLTQGFAGSSEWDIKVGIANGQRNNTAPTIQINARSDLQETRVFFPEPFSKPANLSRHTTANVSIFEGESIDFKVDYGLDVKVKGQLKSDDKNAYGLSVLGLGFSTSPRPLSSAGVKIYGELGRFPLDQWIDYYQTRIASDTTDVGEAMRLVDSVDLDVRTTLFHGREITDTDLIIIRTSSGFIGTIDSSLMKGNFSLPFQQSLQNPIVADLEFLNIQSSDSDTETASLLPQDFVNLKLTSNLMSYDQLQFSDFRLDTGVKGNQLTIDTLAFRHDNISLEAKADWHYLPIVKKHRSELSLSITGGQLGQTLAALDLGDTMQDGNINLNGQIRWSGGLLNLDWDSLMGEGRFEINKGVLKNVDPGSGRLVGLLSLNALPKRLSLDFKDVLIEGLNFDKISGNYKIEGENLYTADTRMDGASARIKISGRTGLRDRDYDQTMLVIPKIRHTLPLIGGLAVGSSVGWGLLLIQSLFKNAIDKSVEVEYKVTGPWADPQLELVKKVIIKHERISK
jgi:uncharacterized protein (TIGR02099 family)